jgi:DNA-binding Xre family transcriptional regulator
MKRVIRLRVKEVAEERGVSQGKLARKADISVTSLRPILRDPQSNITLETLNKLANALGVDARDLIEYTPDPPSWI